MTASATYRYKFPADEGMIQSDRPMAFPSYPPAWITGSTSSLTPLSDMQIKYSSSLEAESLDANPFESHYVLDPTSPMYGWQQNDAQFHPGSQGYLYLGQNENM